MRKKEIVESKFREKYPKLIRLFEKETIHHAIYRNKITGHFKYWLIQKIKYKSLICSECGREFDSKQKLNGHKNWHKSGYRKSRSGENSNLYGRTGDKNSMYGKCGDKHPNYGKCGEESYAFKKNAKYNAKHLWINKHYPQNTFCDDKCEICGKINLNLNLAQFIHIDVRNMENPMIDYFYTCPRNENNSCHRIYDVNLTKEQKEELLAGATTREEKLKRVRVCINVKLKDTNKSNSKLN